VFGDEGLHFAILLPVRRFLTWHLPLAAAVAASAVFAYGLIAYLRGDVGVPVDVSPSRALAAEAPGPAIAPIILGDSLARGTGDESGLGIGGRFVADVRARHRESRNIVNVAVNGARARDLLEQLQSRNVRTLVAESNIVILSIGGNDLWGDNFQSGPPGDPERVMDQVLGHVEEAVHTLRETNPKARLFLIGLYNPFLHTPFGQQLNPFVNRWNARLIERFASDPNVTVVQTSDIFAYEDRLSADRFHPSAEGYERIARRIADAV
jgi:lysophospholipase L1-like esterase